MSRRPLSDVLPLLPHEWPGDLLPAIRAEIAASRCKLAVLDDDPTGTQTVHGIPVLTAWSPARLRAELNDPSPAFYILTNSRSLPAPAARKLARELACLLKEAAASAGRPVRILSRSDSTLRGHFPDETDAIAEGLGARPDALVIAPFFLEGGRYTIDDIHYVLEDGLLAPAAATESARDPVFGYRSSNLREWVEEKTGGRVPAAAVRSLSLDDLRRRGPDFVRDALLSAPPGTTWIVNAAAARDLQVAALGLIRAERAGLNALCRTAASFVPACFGLEAAAPLASTCFPPGDSGGLVLAGSFVPRTTRQLAALLTGGLTESLELNVRELLDPARCGRVVEEAADFASSVIEAGRDAVLYTSREVVSGDNTARSLEIQQAISSALARLVRTLSASPRFILAKGGITASDIATGGLAVERAMVLGQIYPGVPVWRLGPESRYPGMPYVVFPGNVGTPDALVETVARLNGRTTETPAC